MLAFAAVDLATSLGVFLRLALVDSAEVAAWSVADRAFGAVVSAELASVIVVGYGDVRAVTVGFIGDV